jgi:hypothetical protein
MIPRSSAAISIRTSISSVFVRFVSALRNLVAESIAWPAWGVFFTVRFGMVPLRCDRPFTPPA